MARRSFSDQTGYELFLDSLPQRIISLVPSQTELLAYLGLDDRVAGITKFCVHPETWRSRKTIVGGTKKFHFDIIDRLKPDLILANKEENYREGIAFLREKYPVWTSDVVTLEQALIMIDTVGTLTETRTAAHACTTDIVNKFEAVKKHNSHTVLYLIWRNPWMGAGQNTFIDSMLTTIGLKNILASNDRYPQLAEEQIETLAPEYIFLSSEPYPFKRDHIAELSQISPSSKIMLVDGEMFSWYGSRLMQAPDYFNTLELG